MSTGGETCESSSMGFTFLKYSCDSGWITNAKRFMRRTPPGQIMRGSSPSPVMTPR